MREAPACETPWALFFVVDVLFAACVLMRAEAGAIMFGCITLSKSALPPLGLLRAAGAAASAAAALLLLPVIVWFLNLSV